MSGQVQPTCYHVNPPSACSPKRVSGESTTFKLIDYGLSTSYTWNKADTSPVKGYNVYRKHSDSDFVKINTALIADTTYSDSSAIQDENYEYKVSGVDNGDNEGGKSIGVSVLLVSAALLIDSSSYQGYIKGIAVDRNSNIYLTDCTNNLVVVMDSEFNIIDTIASNFNYPHHVAVDSSLNKYIIDRDSIYKFDERDSLLFKVERPLKNVGYALARIGIKDNLELWVKIQHWPLTTLYKFALGGNLIDSIPADYWPPFGDFGFESNGNVVICDQNKLIRLNEDGTAIIKEIELSQGSLQYKPNFEQLEVASNGIIYLVDRENARFIALDTDWSILFKWDSGSSNFSVNEVYGFHLTPSGNLVVTEIDKIRLYSFKVH